MELIKIVGYILIGFIVFVIFVWIVGVVYDVKIIQTACKAWARQIKEQATETFTIPLIIGGYLLDFFCNIWWF